MNGSTKKFGMVGMAVVAVLTGIVLMAGCGGSDSSSDDSAASTQAPAGGPGDMFASLTDDQKQCLDDAGVTIPDGSGTPPQGGEMPQGQPPEGMTPPDGAPPAGATGASGATGFSGTPPEGMQDLQKAMEECGVDLPEPPDGSSGGSAPEVSPS